MSPPVACVGGVFAELDYLTPSLAAGAGECAPELCRPELSAEWGALLLALSAGGIRPPAAVINSWDRALEP